MSAPDFDAERLSPRMRQYRAAQATPKRPTVPSLEREGLLGCAILAGAWLALVAVVVWIFVSR